MISLPAQLPLLQVGSQEVVHYEKEWLQEAISRAAEEAGHEQWWFAEDVAKGMILYLQRRFQGSSITLQELFEKISKMLNAIGFADIAGKLRPTPPPMRISLLEVAREAGAGYELVFFELLRCRLNEMRSFGAEQIQCSDLKYCVKHLRAAKKWNKDCDHLESEIISFIRGRTNRQSLERNAERFSLVMH